jgi:hypothetical protein
MFHVVYRDLAGNQHYRNYKNMEEPQVRKIADRYGKKHDLTWVSIIKVY